MTHGNQPPYSLRFATESSCFFILVLAFCVFYAGNKYPHAWRSGKMTCGCLRMSDTPENHCVSSQWQSLIYTQLATPKLNCSLLLLILLQIKQKLIAFNE